MSELHQEKAKYLHNMAVQGSYSNSREFYLARIRFALNEHNFTQREQLLGMVNSAVLSDRALAVSEVMFILNKVEEAHKKSMEANFNEGW